MNTHLWGRLKICMKSNCCLDSHTVRLLRLEYSKRVYQGVRVKHTVKDLLAEKRSRQTNGPRYSVSTISSKPFCFCPVLSLPTSFFSQTKQRSHSWHSVGATIKRSLSEISSPCLHFNLFCGPTIHGWSIDHLYLPPSVSAPLQRSQSQSVNSWARCVWRETQSWPHKRTLTTILAMASAMISRKTPLGWRWGGKAEVDR